MSAYAKAIVPAVATILAVAIQWAVTGEFDRAELATALTGLLAAVVTYVVPNTPPTTGKGAALEGT
jgi:VIT1/CCC1 family predicted Fe2+/Mn2+ transporter